MTRLACSLSLVAALGLVPRGAAAAPSTAATLGAIRTVAVASEPGVAEAALAPAPGTTTKVAVTVSTEIHGPAAAPPAVAPAPVPPPPVPRYEPRPEDRLAEQIHDDRKSGRGLLAAGLTLAASAYLFTSLSGALAIDRSRDRADDPLTERDEGRAARQRRAFGRALLIPGVGPALAIARADTAVRAWGAGVAGLAQAVGAGLALVGVHRLARARRLERVRVSAMGGARQAHVALQVRF